MTRRLSSTFSILILFHSAASCPFLCRFMSLYLRDKQEIEELALSIFMNLWEGRADLTLKISFKAYLFQSARNRCLNALRDEKDTVPIEGGEEYGYALAADTSVEMEELNRLIEEAVCPSGQMWAGLSQKN